MTLFIATEDGLFEDGDRVRDGSITWVDGDWSVADGSTLVQRQDGRWVDVATAELPLTSVAGGHAPGEAWVGARGGHLLHFTAEGGLEAVAPFEEVDGQDEWYTPWDAPADVRSLAVTGDGVVLVNVHVGGIPRSPDDGRTWQPTIDVQADVHQVIAHPSRPDVALAAAAVGYARSDDGGASWKVSDDGLDGSYSRAVAVSGDHVLLSASTGHVTDRAAIYRRPLDGDAPFERVSDWLPHNVDSGCVAADGDDAAFGGPDGVLSVSGDGGATWARQRDDLPPITALSYSRT